MRIKYRPEDFIVRECFRAFDRDGDGEYGVYSLEKKKLTTFEAIDELSKKLKVPKREIAVAGLKDRQSMSAQLVSIPGPRLQYSTYRLTLRYLGRADEPIKSEANLANRFTLTVRELSHDDLNVFDANLPVVQELGLPNYFDDQRFGCLRFGQGFIVRDMLAGRYEQALRKLIGTPLSSDRKGDRDLKGFIGTMWGKWEGLAEKIEPRQKWHYVVAHLRDNPRDFAGAFAHLGTRFKTIHLFAYQSYLFNEALSNFLYDTLGADDARAGVPYAGGNLTVWKSLPMDLYAELLEQGLTFPLLAHDTKLDDARIKRACEKVLKRENLKLEGLKFEKPDVLFYKTEQRPIALRPQAWKIEGPYNDREFRGRKMLRISFELPRGAYASLVIKRLFVGAQLRDLLAPHAAGVDPAEESHGYDRGFYGRSQPSKKRRAEEKSRPRNDRPAKPAPSTHGAKPHTAKTFERRPPKPDARDRDKPYGKPAKPGPPKREQVAEREQAPKHEQTPTHEQAPTHKPAPSGNRNAPAKDQDKQASTEPRPRSNRPQPPKPGESRPVRKRRFVAPASESEPDE